MPTSVRVRTNVQTEHLHPLSKTITKDGPGRITQMRFDFKSVRVDYDVTWNGSLIEVTTFAKTVADL